jgi:hypothetical protein
MSCTLTQVNKIWKKSTRQGRHNKAVYSYSIISFDFSAHSSFEHLFLPIRVSHFWKSFYRKKFFCFKNAMFMYAHYDKQNHVKFFDATRETTKLLKMSISCTLTRTNKICKKSTHQGRWQTCLIMWHNKSVYSYTIIRFHFSVHSIFEYLFSAHSSFEHLFLPIRFSTFYFLPIRVSSIYFCPFEFQIFKNPFIVKNFFVSKIQCSSALTRTNKNV